MSRYIIFQPDGEPMAYTCIHEGAEFAAAAAQAVPSGVPYWEVDKSLLDHMFANYGQFRGSWKLEPAKLGQPTGMGGGNDQYLASVGA
jgi:hypothetical protein